MKLSKINTFPENYFKDFLTDKYLEGFNLLNNSTLDIQIYLQGKELGFINRMSLSLTER